MYKTIVKMKRKIISYISLGCYLDEQINAGLGSEKPCLREA